MLQPIHMGQPLILRFWAKKLCRFFCSKTIIQWLPFPWAALSTSYQPSAPISVYCCSGQAESCFTFCDYHKKQLGLSTSQSLQPVPTGLSAFHASQCSASLQIQPQLGLHAQTVVFLLFFFFFIKVQSTKHKIIILKCTNSVTFSEFTALGNYHFYWSRTFHHPKENLVLIKQSLLISLPTYPPSNIYLLSVSMSSPILDISYKWNHVICEFLCLTSFS